MQIVLPETSVKMGHEVVEADFGIGDPAAIMGILRGKMYSNPIRTIIQEVGSNARDSHRERARSEKNPALADRAIEIKLPNALDKTLHIRDFGVGISPDRMANVFILYGKSTKRSSNEETGGFGLGAKSPFAYSDSFGIITVTRDHQFTDAAGVCHENCLVRRQYVAYIDPSQKGKMSLQSAELTTDEQGTTIVVTCKPGDYKKFAQHVQEVMAFWPVKPIVKGDPDFKWKEYKTIFSGTDGSWRIDEKTHDYYDSASNQPTAIIDGIPYPLKANELYKDDAQQDQDVHNFLQFPLRVFFATGEVLMTAPREDIDYQDWVIAHVRKRLLAAVKDLRTQISGKISNAKNLWEANIAWRKLSSQFGRLITKAEWKNPADGKMYDVQGDGIYLRDYNSQVFQFTRDGQTIRRKTAYQVNFTENSILAVEDTDVKVPSKLRIATLFDQNPTVNDVQVLVFTGDTAQKVQDTKDKLEKEKNFSLFAPVYLSTIPKKAIVRTAAGGFKVAKVKKFYDSGYKTDQWREADLDLENDEGIYVELRGRDAYLVGTEKLVDTSVLKYLMTTLKIDIYGIPTRFLKSVGEDFTPLQDEVQKEIDKLLQDKDLQDYQSEVENASYSISQQYSYLAQGFMNDPSKLLKLLSDQNGVAYRYITVSSAVTKIQDKVNKLAQLQRAVDSAKSSGKNGKATLANLCDDFAKRYPLVKALNSWDAKGIKPQDLAFYLNACDAAVAPAAAPAVANP